MSEDARSSRSRARRRERDPAGARRNLIGVKLNDDEHEKVLASAAAVNMQPASYLALRGVQDLAGDSGAMPPPQLRAWVVELYALKRLLRGATTNLNQLTRVANATEAVPPEAWHHVRYIADMEERVTALLDTIGPELKPPQ